jgi:beta-carotene hydroxylase
MSEDLTALNKQAIAAAHQYMGGVAWFTVAFTFLVVVAFVLHLAAFAQGYVPVWVAVLIMAALTYASYTPLHEAAHGNIHGNKEDLKWLNDLCGYLVAPMISVPYASHRHEHFTHHRYTNQPDKDPDFVISGIRKGPLSAFLTILKFIWVQNSFFAKYKWTDASIKDRAIYVFEVVFSISWRALFITLIDQPGTALVILLGYLMGGAFTAYWFAYRPHLPYKEPKRYRNTNSLIMPVWMKPFEWIWLGQNLHSIHHLFPRVPFYKYHALHKEIEPVLRAHGTPIIGIFNRKVT